MWFSPKHSGNIGILMTYKGVRLKEEVDKVRRSRIEGKIESRSDVVEKFCRGDKFYPNFITRIE